jgi:hypothetical protein
MSADARKIDPLQAASASYELALLDFDAANDSQIMSIAERCSLRCQLAQTMCAIGNLAITVQRYSIEADAHKMAVEVHMMRSRSRREIGH